MTVGACGSTRCFVVKVLCSVWTRASPSLSPPSQAPTLRDIRQLLLFQLVGYACVADIAADTSSLEYCRSIMRGGYLALQPTKQLFAYRGMTVAERNGAHTVVESVRAKSPG